MKKRLILTAAILGFALLSACGEKKASETAGSSVGSTVSGEESTSAKESAGKETEKTGEKESQKADASAYQDSGVELKFTAKNLNKEDISNDIFAEKDLTVLNVWGTFCGPCINEMPELASWSKEMPENVQIIGLVADISGDTDEQHIDLAKKIMEQSKGDFQNIIPNENFSDLLSTVVGVPTTYFINKDGKIIGKPIVGAQVAKYKAFVNGYLETLNK